MQQRDIIDFFDRLAPRWDAEMIRNDRKIARILDACGIREGVRVLDVACGTGVLFPDYLARHVRSVTGVDISPEMINRAGENFTDSRISLVLADIQQAVFSEPFDCCMVYNAFPHFPDPDALLHALSRSILPGGRVAIAHGMGQGAINAHHSGAASNVSIALMDADALAALMERHGFHADTVVSEEGIYIVAGQRDASFNGLSNPSARTESPRARRTPDWKTAD